MAEELTPIHPDLHDVLKKFPRFPLNRWTVKTFRWLTGLMPQPDLPDQVQLSQMVANSHDSGPPVKLRVYQPRSSSAPAPALLWIHGGGLVIGTPRMDDTYVSRFVAELGIVVVSVDYRLAPEHPFPAAIDDCHTALKWLHAHASALGIDPQRVAVGGQSAGAGLAAALAQLTSDQGEIAPIFQLLVYPMLDDRSALQADHPHLETMTWPPRSNHFGWRSYLRQPPGLADTPPYAVPGRREDLAGLPPAWIGVGELDLFRQEAAAYADALKRCGIDCQLVLVDGAFHGFDVFDDDVPLIQDFRRSQVDALRRHLFAS